MSSYCSPLDTPYLRPVALPDRSLAMSPLSLLAAEGKLLSEAEQAEQADGSWLGFRSPDALRARRCWGLQMDLGEPNETDPTCFAFPGLQAPPSPPASPTSTTSRIPTALNGDGARVLRRRKSLHAASPPPSPTKRIKQRFGVGDDGDDDPPPLPPFTQSDSMSSFSPNFPLSPVGTTALAAAPPSSSLAPTLRRSTSLSRLLGNPSPLRRRSTTALFRPPEIQAPELQLSRSSSDTKGKPAASGWKRELGVLSETAEGEWGNLEVTGGSQFCINVSYGRSGGRAGARRLTITNPDELKVNDEDNLAENEAKVSMDVEHTSEVGLAM